STSTAWARSVGGDRSGRQAPTRSRTWTSFAAYRTGLARMELIPLPAQDGSASSCGGSTAARRTPTRPAETPGRSTTSSSRPFPRNPRTPAATRHPSLHAGGPGHHTLGVVARRSESVPVAPPVERPRRRVFAAASFLGRAADLDALRARYAAGARLVTIVGPG